MGRAKDAALEAEEARHTATEIAVEAGALGKCPYHEYVTAGSLDYEGAYRFGSAKLKRGDLGGFNSQKELTDEIKAAIDDHYFAICPGCEANSRE